MVVNNYNKIFTDVSFLDRHHNHHLKHHNRNSYLLESYSSSSSIESLSEDVASKTNSSVEQSNNSEF